MSSLGETTFNTIYYIINSIKCRLTKRDSWCVPQGGDSKTIGEACLGWCVPQGGVVETTGEACF